MQAGPGTIAEALIRGLPIILNDYIPGQVSHQFLLHVDSLTGHIQLTWFLSKNHSANNFPFIRKHQEKGNVPYVVDNGAGVFTRSPKETARIVTEWFSTKTDELKRMSENALKLAQPEAVVDIVKDIHDLAAQRGPLARVPYMLTASFTSII